MRSLFVGKGELMSFNHGLLNAMGVGHPALTKVFEASSRHGGMACKLTGAGGGGCAITLVPDGSEHLESLRNELWCDHIINFAVLHLIDCVFVVTWGSIHMSVKQAVMV